MLVKYPWPGNIRELDHTIEKAVILSNQKIIDTKDILLNPVIPETLKIKNPRTLDEIEKDAIIKALDNNNWNISEAAKELNISRQSIYNKMKKYDL